MNGDLLHLMRPAMRGLGASRGPRLFAGDGGGGSGGSGGSGNGDNGGAGGGDKPLTREEINALMNSVVTGRLNRFREDMSAEFKKLPTAESLTDAIIGKLKESGLGGGQTQGQGSGQTQGQGGGQLPPEVANQLAKQEAELKRLREQNEAREREAREVKQKAALAEEHGALEKELRRLGVPEARLKGAVLMLHDNLKRADDGSIYWPKQREGYVDNLPVTKAMDEWAKTDEGKAFLPPVDTSGTGKGRVPTRSGGNSGQQLTQGERDSLLAGHLFGGTGSPFGG